MGAEPEEVRYVSYLERDWVSALASTLVFVALALFPILAIWILDQGFYLLLLSVPIGLLCVFGISETLRAYRTRRYVLCLDESGVQVLESRRPSAFVPWDRYGGYRWRALGRLERFIHPERSGLELLGREGSVELFFPVPPAMKETKPQPGRYWRARSCAFAATIARLQERSAPGMFPEEEPFSPEAFRLKLWRTLVVATLFAIPGWIVIALLYRHWQSDDPLPSFLSGFVLLVSALAAFIGTAVLIVAAIVLALPRGPRVKRAEPEPTELSLHYARTGGEPADIRLAGSYRYAAVDEVEPKLRARVKDGKPGFFVVLGMSIGFLGLFLVSAATGNPTATVGTGLGIFAMFFLCLVQTGGGYLARSRFLDGLRDSIISDSTGIAVQRVDGSVVRFSAKARLLPLGMEGVEVLVEKRHAYVLRRALLKRETD